ncbi:MAG: hypothetical protein KAI70_00525 [Candidatus Omnitrophica bacterium]|nr:hypothetical protein [Candidatus Omnitrophota bacterium]
MCEISVEVLSENGYHQAMLGLSLNKDQPVEKMGDVANKLCDKDGGHNKFMEQIIVWLMVRAPRYWWQEADTYRMSSKSSQSTMHTILSNRLAPQNFELDSVTHETLDFCNYFIRNNKLFELKRVLPEGFMQKRMWMLSYKAIRNIVLQRKNHRLPHWTKLISVLRNNLKHPELLPFDKE